MALDPRPLTFLRTASSAIEMIWQRSEVACVAIGLNTLHDSLQRAAADIERQPTIVTEDRFFRLIGDTAKSLAAAAEFLPDFKGSETYRTYLDAAYQVGLFIAGK